MPSVPFAEGGYGIVPPIPISVALAYLCSKAFSTYLHFQEGMGSARSLPL